MLPSPSTSNSANALLSFVISSLGNLSSNIFFNDGNFSNLVISVSFYCAAIWKAVDTQTTRIRNFLSFLANYLFTSVCGQTKSQYQNIVKWRWSKMSNFSVIQQICNDNAWKNRQYLRELCLGSSNNQYFLCNVIECKLLFLIQ